jgi:hypothetical protein
MRRRRSTRRRRHPASSTSPASAAWSTPRSIAAPKWARVEARDVARPDFRIYSGHERALDMVSYGSDYCSPRPVRPRRRSRPAIGRGGPDGRSASSSTTCCRRSARSSTANRSPARVNGVLQWLQVRGILGHVTPVAGVPSRPDSDVALYRELSARLDSLLASTDALDLAARASAATAP